MKVVTTVLLTLLENLQLVSMMPVINLPSVSGVNLECEYLRDFSKKNKNGCQWNYRWAGG
jgi:hypothetical protein